MLAASWCGQANAAPRLQVRGSSRLEVQVSDQSDSVRIQATLRDETSKPLPGQAIELHVIDTLDKPVRWQWMRGCDTTGSNEVRGSIITTDAHGKLCVEGQFGLEKCQVRAIFGGDALHEATMTQVTYAAQEPLWKLSFLTSSGRVDLDAARVGILASVSRTPKAPLRGTPVKLLEHDGTELAVAQADETGALYFDVPSARVWGPGIRELRVSLAEVSNGSQAQATTLVTRVAQVRLTPQHTIISGDTLRGIPLKVAVETLRGPVNEGLVEVMWEGKVVWTATVRDGSAQLLVRIGPQVHEKHNSIELRYVAQSSYLQASIQNAVVQVQQKAPSRWLQVLPFALVLVVGAWLLKGWWRPKRRTARKGKTAKQVEAQGVAGAGEGVTVIKGRRAAAGRWSGIVVDAHDGTPIEGATLRVMQATYTSERELMRVDTDESGRFAFKLKARMREPRLRVQARFHTELVRELPPGGELLVQLVSRRRALVDRLVGWARGQGTEWREAPEPTPGHVIRVAKAHQASEVEHWATQVEQGAYGAEPVDQAREAEVEHLRDKIKAVR